jgi:hypothetical protein
LFFELSKRLLASRNRNDFVGLLEEVVRLVPATASVFALSQSEHQQTYDGKANSATRTSHNYNLAGSHEGQRSKSSPSPMSRTSAPLPHFSAQLNAVGTLNIILQSRVRAYAMYAMQIL